MNRLVVLPDPRTKQFCNCAETLLTRADGTTERVPSPAHHDCDYCRRRAELIPAAVAIADAQNPIEDYDKYGPVAHGNRWTRSFALAMDRLAWEASK